MTRVAVVTVVHGRRRHLAAQRASLAASPRPPDHHVVVAVDDPEVEELPEPGCTTVRMASTPLGLPVAAARNRGARIAVERGATTLVFLDVDCLAGSELVASYHDAVSSRPNTVWSGPVTYLDPPPPAGYDLTRLEEMDAPHRARPAPAVGECLLDADPDLFWSLSFACSTPAWQTSGGFCEDYVGYGGEDTDFARVVRAAGLDLGWLGSARAYHQWHPVSSPPVEHVADIVRNAELFRTRWARTPMLGWLRAFEEQGLVTCDAAGRWRRVT